jgi:hypothetical protein
VYSLILVFALDNVPSAVCSLGHIIQYFGYSSKCLVIIQLTLIRQRGPVYQNEHVFMTGCYRHAVLTIQTDKTAYWTPNTLILFYVCLILTLYYFLIQWYRTADCMQNTNTVAKFNSIMMDCFGTDNPNRLNGLLDSQPRKIQKYPADKKAKSLQQ